MVFFDFLLLQATSIRIEFNFESETGTNNAVFSINWETEQARIRNVRHGQFAGFRCQDAPHQHRHNQIALAEPYHRSAYRSRAAAWRCAHRLPNPRHSFSGAKKLS